jgi:hypothetical protein
VCNVVNWLTVFIRQGYVSLFRVWTNGVHLLHSRCLLLLCKNINTGQASRGTGSTPIAVILTTRRWCARFILQHSTEYVPAPSVFTYFPIHINYDNKRMTITRYVDVQVRYIHQTILVDRYVYCDCIYYVPTRTMYTWCVYPFLKPCNLHYNVFTLFFFVLFFLRIYLRKCTFVNNKRLWVSCTLKLVDAIA